MTTSSIYHFFARLMQRRGYFVENNKLEHFEFPDEMIAARSGSGFPDFVLKTNPDEMFSGGEFLELKDAKSHTITPFNSTLPSARKNVAMLDQNVRGQMIEAGEDLEAMPEREVYYLIRGVKRAQPSPLAKTLLVSGAFFETVPSEQVLSDAFEQVTEASIPEHMDAKEIAGYYDVQQKNFAATRQIEGSSISVRFRVMVQVDAGANLMSSRKYPMIGTNTLTLLLHEDGLSQQGTFDWDDAPATIRECGAYVRLNIALEDVEHDLKRLLRVSVLHHPKNGPFFMAQV